MSGGWASRLLRTIAAGGGDHARLAALDRRALRASHALAAAARVRELAADAAAKQGGGFVLDRRYVAALAEGTVAAAEDVVLDLNLVIGARHLDLLSELDSVHTRARALLEDGGGVPRREPSLGAGVAPAVLAAALERADALFREAGEVVCRGVAAGPLRRVEAPGELDRLEPGAVVLAARLGAEAARPALAAVAALVVEGDVAEEVAAQAQARRIPALEKVGPLDVPGDAPFEVTVDADDGTVYRGRISALLAYQGEMQRAEEPEYELLRSMRRALFEAGTDGGGSLQEVVDRAVAGLAAAFAERVVRDHPAAWPPPVVQLTPSGPDAGAGPPCPPAQAILAGCAAAGRAQPSVVLAREERAWVVVPRAAGRDLVYAQLGPERFVVDLCRAVDSGASAAADGGAAVGVELERLGFTTRVGVGTLTARFLAAGIAPAVRRLAAVGALVTAAAGCDHDCLAELVGKALAHAEVASADPGERLA